MPVPILAANSTWFTQGGTSVKRSSITEIEIVDTYTATGNETAFWDASAAKDGSVMAYVKGTKLTLAGNGYGAIYANPDSSYAFSHSKDFFSSLTSISGSNLLDTSKATTFSRMFDRASSLSSLDISDWDTSSVTSMERTFQGCVSLTELDLSNWDVSQVTTMQSMFMSNDTFGYMSLTTIGDVGNWDISNVTSLRSMFAYCSSLKALDVSTWNIGNVNTLNSVFLKCASLSSLDVSDWNTSNVTDMYQVFAGCISLETLDVSKWDVSQVTTMENMFMSNSEFGAMSLTSIGDVGKWNTSRVNTMATMFQSCESLTALDVSRWDTSSVTDMRHMFNDCFALEELNVSNWDVSKVTSFARMFSGSSDYGHTPIKIKELDVSKWDTSSATDMAFMFYGCQGPGAIDVSGWDVSKVTTFDHMFAHSYLAIGDTSNWNVTTACTNLNGLFHTVQNTTLNVSNFNTSNVTVFEQMFEFCDELTEIIGLENFDTSSGLGFTEMFSGCSSLKELNLSSFNTTNAKDGAFSSDNGTKTETLKDMFAGVTSLEKITLGANFSFNGDGTTTDATHVAVLPTPSSDYIDGADGKWHKADGTEYAASDMPTNTFGVYYASTKIFDRCLVVKYGAIAQMADAVRVATGANRTYEISEMIKELLELQQTTL